MNDLIPTRLLITSGATQEPIDEVRYLGNRSSGKLGCLIALTAAIRGYEVTLLHGIQSVSPSTHPRLHSIPYSSTRDLAAKVDECWTSHEILIMAAAVSDYTPRGGQQHGKLQRGEELDLALCPTEDIVASLASKAREEQKIIAFALEDPETLEIRAMEKLRRKRVDAIIANPLETMDSSTIKATVIRKDGTTLSPEATLSKPAFAQWLIDHLESIVGATPCTP